ncbi:MAG: META domain-containing protein [Rikenellaceae bacterium]
MTKIQFLLLSTISLAVSCGSIKSKTQNESFNLESTKWQAEQLNGEAIESVDERFTLSFNTDGKISGKGACNILFGSYTSNTDGTFSISPLGVTRTACPDMDIETQYIRALESTTSYSVIEDQLLLLNGDEVIIKFSLFE